MIRAYYLVASYLLAWMLLASCGKAPSTSEAYLYAAKFDELAKAHGYYSPPAQSFTINFPDLGAAKEKIDCPNRTLSIDGKIWADIRDGFREAAVFHVLAHCVVKRGHRTGNTTAGVAINSPLSLMHPDFVPGNFFVLDRLRYVEELFVAPFPNDTVFP